MPPDPPQRRLRPVLVALALLALAATAVLASPAEAHGSKWGTAAHAGSTGFHVYLTEYDVQQDGHCANGRFHLGGSWVVVATDCSHSPLGNGVHSGYWPASGTISVSSCLNNHGASSSTCHYGQYQTYRSIDLGNVP